MTVGRRAQALPKKVGNPNAEKQKVAFDILTALGIKPAVPSVTKLVAWFNQEGGNWNNSARYNPLNTTYALPGAGNTGSQGNIKVYTSWKQGIEATVKTLRAPAYTGILSTLAGGTPAQFEAAVNSSPWGTKFPGGGGAVANSGVPNLKKAEAENMEYAKSPAEEAAGAAGEKLSALGFNWANLSKFALTTVLVIAGAILVIYGIMVAVRPRASALSNPLKGVPVPVPV